MSDPSAVVGSASSSTIGAGRGHWIVRRLYTSNPFYILSAELVFVGLRASFQTSGDVFETSALTVGLAAYTLLLAITACLLIRLGRVWDDVRSILLLVVLMFVAMSVTFDDTLAARPRLGVAYAVGGFLFAALVSEGLLRGIRLKLPALFRVPYFLILGLFFLYPVALVPLLKQPDSEALLWSLFGFSTVAGLAFLTLLPAIRRGPELVADNGSPWKWPLYPWVLFGLLALSICLRASYLCISMHFVERSAVNVSRSSSIFGLYFLVPFLYVVSILLLEIGRQARNRTLLQVVFAVPAGLVILCMVDAPSNVVAERFHGLFVSRLGGSPLFLTLLAAVGFYGYAVIRRVESAVDALGLALLALAFLEPKAASFGVTTPRPLPLMMLGALQIAIAVRSSSSYRALIGALSLVVAAMAVLPAEYPPASRALVAVHLGLLAMLVLGAVYNDALGRFARRAGALVMFLACTLTLIGSPLLATPFSPEARTLYVALIVALALGYGALLRDRWYYFAALGGVTSWIAACGWRSYLALRETMAGLDFLIWGFASFVVAALISLRKAGGLRKWPTRLPSKNDLLQ